MATRRVLRTSNPLPELPVGGSTGQVIVKVDSPDGEADWGWLPGEEPPDHLRPEPPENLDLQFDLTFNGEGKLTWDPPPDWGAATEDQGYRLLAILWPDGQSQELNPVTSPIEFDITNSMWGNKLEVQLFAYGSDLMDVYLESAPAVLISDVPARPMRCGPKIDTARIGQTDPDALDTAVFCD